MKHSVKITTILITIFFFAQLLGLVIIQNYIDTEQTAETGEIVFENLPLGIERPQVEEQFSFVYILAAVLIGTLLVLLLMKYKIHRLWKVWYFLAVFITLTMAFGAFIPSIWAGLLGFGIALWKIMKTNVFVHNVSELFIYGGLAAVFVPIMNVFAGIMLLILISLYDMYAVWKSKHMIKLAEFQTKTNVFAGFYVPYHLPKRVIKAKGKKIQKKVKTAILGGGDIAFPLLFAGAVMKEVGFLPSLLISAGATIALIGLLFGGKQDRFYPAMPYLTVGCFIGYGIILLL